MPSREEIAEWIFDGANEIEHTYRHMPKKTKIALGIQQTIDKLRERAAQVSAMRCETCTYYRDASASESEWCTNEKCGTIRNQGKSFGCFAHKPKPAG